MTRVYREEGLIALWRGNWANVIRYFPTTALNFAFKGVFGKIYGVDNKNKSKLMMSFSNIMAGGSAGAACMTFVYPLDFARTRMGVDVGKSATDRQFNGLKDCLVKIFKHDGVKGLYQGFGISVFSIFIYRGLYFGGFDTGKSLLPGYNNFNFFQKFFFAQVVTNFSEILSYPFDTVRRRLMMNSGLETPIYKNTLHCFQ